MISHDAQQKLNIDNDIAADMARYQQSRMADDEIISFFQRLVSCGVLASLPVGYSETAKRLTAAGLVRPNPHSHCGS